MLAKENAWKVSYFSKVEEFLVKDVYAITETRER